MSCRHDPAKYIRFLFQLCVFSLCSPFKVDLPLGKSLVNNDCSSLSSLSKDNFHSSFTLHVSHTFFRSFFRSFEEDLNLGCTFFVRLSRFLTRTLCWCLWTQKVGESRGKGEQFNMSACALTPLYRLWIDFWPFLEYCLSHFLFSHYSSLPVFVFLQSAQEVSVPAEPASSVQPVQRRSCPGVWHPSSSLTAPWWTFNLGFFMPMLSLFPQTALLPESAWIQDLGMWRRRHCWLAAGCDRYCRSFRVPEGLLMNNFVTKGSMTHLWFQTGKTCRCVPP